MHIGIKGDYFPAICRVCFFYRKYYSFRRCFDLKAKREKLPYELIYSERDKFFDHALRLVNDFLTLKSSF